MTIPDPPLAGGRIILSEGFVREMFAKLDLAKEALEFYSKSYLYDDAGRQIDLGKLARETLEKLKT